MTAGDKEQALSSTQLIEESLEDVRRTLIGLRFGTVLLTVHEGRIVQIDVTEKRRLTPK